MGLLVRFIGDESRVVGALVHLRVVKMRLTSTFRRPLRE